MSTATTTSTTPTTPTSSPDSSPTSSPTSTAENVFAGRPAPRPIPFPRLVSVELRKMFDTRSGFWLMAAVVLLSVLASGAVVAFAGEENIVYGSFAQAIGFPMALVLPIIAILSVTSEWSQRSGLTTFTLVPDRRRTIAAKLVCAVLVGVVGMCVAAGVGVLGNLVGAAVAGIDPVWNMSLEQFAAIVSANVLGVLVGFTFGTVVRHSGAALVAYLIYMYVLSTLSLMLASVQEWYADLEPWVLFNSAQGALFEGFPGTGEEWAQLAVTGTLWLVLPLAFGLWRTARVEIK